MVGQATDAGGSNGMLAAAVRPDCVVDAVLITRVGTNRYNSASMVSATADGQILIRGRTSAQLPPPWQYFKMFLDPSLTPDHTELDDSIETFFVAGQAPYPDSTVVLVGWADVGTRAALKKESPDGTRVLTFGDRGDGNATFRFGPFQLSFGTSGTLQSDGEVLFVAGEIFDSGFQNAMASLTPDGAVISTNVFGRIRSNAEMTTAVAPRSGPGFVGAMLSIPGGFGQSRAFLYCALDDLTLDESCGSDGFSEIEVIRGNTHYLRGLAPRNGGYVGLGSSCPVGERCQAFVFCADENIAIDKSCVGDGVRMIDLGPGDNLGTALTARANGTYVALMSNCPSSSACRPAIACFDADLSPIACQ